MSDRRDKKGRILRKGESQRADGMYMYRYTDQTGKRRTAYSWRLTQTDKTPAGKKDGRALRDIEKEITKEIDAEIDQDAAQLTLNDGFRIMMEARQDLRATTRKNYAVIYDTIVRDKIGTQKLKSIKHSGLQKFYATLATDDHYAWGTILSVHNIILQIFNQALLDRKIQYNPATHAFSIIQNSDLCPPPKKKKALTEQEQAAFIDYVYSERTLKPYANLITVLLGTGLRIGECIGLRPCDCDFKSNLISVNHTLTYKETEDQGYHWLITKPKTQAGYRVIPMFQEVRQALLSEIERSEQNPNPVFKVGEYDHFIFINSKGTPLRASFVYQTLQRAAESYNQKEGAIAALERRTPLYLPEVTPHILRHTFCTRLCEYESNIKVIQEVMGHKRSATTLDVYADAQKDMLQKNFDAIAGKIKLI